MDVLREHLMYKDVPTHICMDQFNPQERYEIIRLLIATRTENVTLCLDQPSDWLRLVMAKVPVKILPHSEDSKTGVQKTLIPTQLHFQSQN